MQKQRQPLYLFLKIKEEKDTSHLRLIVESTLSGGYNAIKQLVLEIYVCLNCPYYIKSLFSVRPNWRIR